jgi:hypothetical protein
MKLAKEISRDIVVWLAIDPRQFGKLLLAPNVNENGEYFNLAIIVIWKITGSRMP